MPVDTELLALQEAVRGRFAIERELGRGGMGVVVLARDLALDRAVAIKVLPLVLARQPALRERFLREARTAAGLSHPNIVPIHSVEEHDDVVFFVMGYVDGETLARRVARAGALAAGEVTRLVQEVAWALAYAHGRGIVHRDVKPDNILIERATGRALVTDFGIARVADATRALTLDGHVMGTAQFMSPEQAAGEAVDGRSDLYALGVVAFHALTGELPFEADSVTALLAMQVTRTAPSIASRRPGLPSRLSAAIDRCLAKRAEDRFASAEALADALAEVDTHVVVVPPQVRNFQRVAEQSTLMVIMVVLFTSVAMQSAGARWWAALGPTVGVFASVTVDLLRRARELMYDGFGAGDVVRAFLLERDAREAEVKVLYHGARQVRLRRVRRRAFALAAVGVAAFAAMFILRHRVQGVAHTVMLVVGMSLYVIGVIALVVGINASERAEKRAGSAASRLWRSGFTLAFFRVAGIGMRPDDRGPQPVADGPRVEIPDDVKRELPALPALIERYDDVLAALRSREEQVERALAEAGPAPLESATDIGDGGGIGVTTRAVLLHRRLSLVGDLRSALESVRARRTDVIAAHENVRIQLARVRAGVAKPRDLAPDVDSLASLLDSADA